jgi:hypothetical protein
MTLQEQYNEKRQKNLSGQLSHSELYLWLADSIHISVADLPVSLERVRVSNDPYLNDIALIQWDRRDAIVRHKAASFGMRSWSLSDTVCVLKCYARREAARAS